MDYANTLVGSIGLGFFLYIWTDKVWLLFVFIFWGVLGNLFLLVKKINRLQQREDEKKNGTEDKVSR